MKVSHNIIVSCKTISIEELDKITPVNPPKVNRNTKPKDQSKEEE